MDYHSHPPADRADSSEPPATGWSRNRMVLVVAAVVVGLLLGVRFQPDGNVRPIDEDDDEITPQVENPGYVGIAVCAECHAKRAREFSVTRHALACVKTSGIRSKGFEPGRGLHLTNDPNLHFEMSRTGSEYSITGFQKSDAGNSTASYLIDLAYGAAGKSDEMYFAWQQDQLFVHHIGWLYPYDRWGHAAHFVGARSAQTRCLECHNTWIAHVPGSVNRYKRDEMLLGVTCERCHGPGREHAVHHRSQRDIRAHAIIHPGRLDRERQIEVCTQCHSGSFQRKTPPMSYRPGQPLDAHFSFTENRHAEDDLTGNQIQYLRQSKCFQKSDMTCTTCHDPHRPHDHSASSKSCSRCHEPSACREQPRLPIAVRGDCVGCHAPPRVWMGALFHTKDDQYVPVTLRSDHRIAIHPEATKSVLLSYLRRQKSDAASRAEADRLAAQLSEHWIAEADRRRSEKRLTGVNQALREAMRIDPNPTTAKLLQGAVTRQAELERLIEEAEAAARPAPEKAIELLKQILVLKPDHAKTHGKLGALHLRAGRKDEATRLLQAVEKLDPHDSFGLTMLAGLAVQDGRAEHSLDLYSRADRAEPFNAAIHFQWGTALVGLQRWAEAEGHFRTALVIDSRHVGAAEGVSTACRQQGQFDHAIQYARRAVSWSREQSVDAWQTLADAYFSAARPDDARAALERALMVAQTMRPDRVDAIRRKLDSLR